MSKEYEEGLHLLPEHMRGSMRNWIELGLPSPSGMGSFFRAVLCNDFVTAVAAADDINSLYLRDWSAFLYNYMPRGSWGDGDIIRAWHEKKQKEREESWHEKERDHAEI